MKTLVFATNNPHKLEELRSIVGEKLRILSLADISCNDEIEETGADLRENACIKARHISERYGYDCISDDTGLMVDALGGAPGVRSARYAGEQCDSKANMALLLRNLKGCAQRSARFVTAICLILDGKEEIFEGTVEGEILEQPEGEEGFGYDPLFRPAGYSQSFAMMSATQKNAISHRGRAVKKLLERLQQAGLV